MRASTDYLIAFLALVALISVRVGLAELCLVIGLLRGAGCSVRFLALMAREPALLVASCRFGTGHTGGIRNILAFALVGGGQSGQASTLQNVGCGYDLVSRNRLKLFHF